MHELEISMGAADGDENQQEGETSTGDTSPTVETPAGTVSGPYEENGHGGWSPKE